MKKKDLAQALGISGSMVSRLAKQGMPTDSVSAARAWRELHLETVRMKGFRADTLYTPQPSKRVPAAEDAMRTARAVLDAGGAFGVVEPGLRAALKAVPDHERHLVGLDVEVMRVLLRPLFDLMQEDGEPVCAGDGLGMSDADAAYVGRVLYLLACGEMVVNPAPSVGERPTV